MGLTSNYNNDATFALKVKIILALVFVPEEHIKNYIYVSSENLSIELQPLLDYF